MYVEYAREVLGQEMVVTPEGFAAYIIYPEAEVNGKKIKEVYLVDIFVRPDFRNQHFGSILIDEVARLAKEQGCTTMTGTVVPSRKTATASTMAFIKYGARIEFARDDLIVLRKEI